VVVSTIVVYGAVVGAVVVAGTVVATISVVVAAFVVGVTKGSVVVAAGPLIVVIKIEYVSKQVSR